MLLCESFIISATKLQSWMQLGTKGNKPSTKNIHRSCQQDWELCYVYATFRHFNEGSTRCLPGVKPRISIWPRPCVWVLIYSNCKTFIIRLCETPTAVIWAKAGARDLLSFSPPSLSRLLSPQFATDNQRNVSIPVAHDQSEPSIRSHDHPGSIRSQ